MEPIFCNNKCEFEYFTVCSVYADNIDYILYGVVDGQITRIFSVYDAYKSWDTSELVEPSALIWIYDNGE